MANEALKGLWGLVERMEANALPPHKDCTNGWAAELKAELEKLPGLPPTTEDDTATNAVFLDALRHSPAMPGKELEQLAAELHWVYQREAKRQGDVRHKDNYADLPENVKQFDRVLAKFVLEREAKVQAEAEARSKESIASWMITHSFATGHGDTIADLLGELAFQAEARGPITHMREITGNPDIDGPIEGQKWVECDKGACGAVAWRWEKGEA
jgi:hypothetical protein